MDDCNDDLPETADTRHRQPDLLSEKTLAAFDRIAENTRDWNTALLRIFVQNVLW